MVRCHGRKSWGAGQAKTAGLRYTDAIELNYLMKNEAAPRVSDQCPRCLRTGRQRRRFPDGSCVSRAACDQERAAAIAEGLINEESEMSITAARKIPTAELVNMPIKEIVKQHGIALTDAYKLRKEAAAELNSAGASESLKAQVLAVVTKFGQQPDLLSIQELLDDHPSMVDISKAVWSAQKQGELTFYERKKGRDSILTQIKLPKGHKAVIHSSPSKVHAVGRDMTEARYQPAVAPGGPIEHIPARAEPIKQTVIPTPFVSQAIADAKLDSVEGFHTVKPSRDPLPQNEKPPRAEPIETPKKGYDVDGAVWLTNLEKDYPLIFGLWERAEKRISYEAAAKTLEGIDDEMALELLGKVSMEPLEEELVKYVRATQEA